MFNRSLFFALVAAVALVLVQCSRLSTLQSQHAQTTSALLAAQDTARHYQDQYGRSVVEKRGIEADMKTLNNAFNILSKNQQALVQDLKSLPKAESKRLASATSIVQHVAVVRHVNIDSAALSRHDWSLASDSLRYRIRARGDTLYIDSLTIPNRLLVTHYRDQKDVLHITARNTNPLIHNQDVDAVIPPAKKRKWRTVWTLLAGAIVGVLASR
ncbi:hypothetical protein I2I05_08565 [Hymenobacter sp. BT683]|uniref:Uncharacterized protein n=1 Tax=Hymenobacter jeongseonensis TaxID=2791027 RepID=A0ABS0IGF9_9BACT|nr:hypothetical protein [Hymenobacter jeongseonensis]MBF9237449.1 hypothetical protein [Hymenobacter jeongseonensis]